MGIIVAQRNSISKGSFLNSFLWKTKGEFDKIVPMKKNLFIFSTAFVIFGIAVLTQILFTHGIWMYYGDFNVQQIPFYMHLHEVIREGNLFGYDWNVDLGGGVIPTWSFYILGSPFFWLTIPFPKSFIPYMMPWLNALKYALMALSSYIYLKRHTEREASAFVGALLYAFSGYAGAVLAYNHFHDVMAFFPFYLVLFERMEEQKKRLGFILMTAFLAMLNYYFFVGEVVFLVIYFLVRYHNVKGFLRALWTGAVGMLLSMWYLIPATYYTRGNGRVSQILSGYDFVRYSEPSMLLGILKNTVMLSDLSGLNSMFNTSYSRVSGVGAYLPLISVSGVIGFFYLTRGSYEEEDRWLRNLLITCGVFAVVPGLNAMFSALNQEYYARWYFMPILMMALASAKVFDRIEEPRAIPYLKKGAFATAAITIGISLCALVPAKNDDGAWTFLGNLHNPEQLMAEIGFSALMLLALFLLIYRAPLTWFLGMRLKMIFTVAALLTATFMMIEGGLLIESNRKEGFVTQALKSEPELPGNCDWYRVETEEDVYNYPMIWDVPTSTSFISTIPSSTIDFYKSQGITRKVTSKLGFTRVGARSLLCDRFFLFETGTAIETIGHIENVEEEFEHYNLIGNTDDFDLYEYKYYVPEGISFDYCMSKAEYDEYDTTNATRDRLLMKAIILNDAQMEMYGSLMEPITKADENYIDMIEFTDLCKERKETACTHFTPTKKGFTAQADLSKDNLVLFSVPYDDGFKAYVDGKETEFINADGGLIALFVPKGKHSIEFKYNAFNTFTAFFKNIIDERLGL